MDLPPIPPNFSESTTLQDSEKIRDVILGSKKLILDYPDLL